MTRLGFLLDSASCIGCHACTVACKAEHDVPLGVNRTWVKYVEHGEFPSVARSFTVMRCNHCDDAPCTAICPTDALFRAANGVVDFDDRNCIGCKACMNACPYDAVHINPATNTAQKCNFCNHRIDQGLEPSCVVVCPTHAIRVADLDDPTDPVTARLLADDLPVRAPEQGTRPKVFYGGADAAALDPLRSAIATDGMIWADTTPDHPSPPADTPGRTARTAYTTAHRTPWGAKVSGYLVTKAIAAGTMLVATLLVALGHGDRSTAVGIVPPLVAGLFLAVTGALLVGDLRQPRRFHYLLTRGSRTSWLVKGAWVLAGFAVLCAAWWVGGLAGSSSALALLAVPTALAAAATAGYTALLFAQCEGRDLWQTPVVLPMLTAQAIAAGGASFALLDTAMTIPAPGAVRLALLGGAIAVLLLTAAEIRHRPCPSVELALQQMTRGAFANRYRLGVGALATGAAVTAVALALDLEAALPAGAGLLVLLGLWAYEDAFVRAGQSVPLS